jgi:arylsulfatase
MIKLILTLLILLAVATPAVAQQPQKQNVVFILADNVGYGDLGSYGGGELRGAPTPRLDQLAREGLRLTQFLVEPACTPSRAALMTGQYSIRNGLSLIAIEGSPYTLPAGAFTMGQLFKSVGYATAIFGKWHLGGAPQSLPTAHGFDEFYGIPPDISWDAATYVGTMELTGSVQAPPGVLLARGPQIVEATSGGPLRTVKAFYPGGARQHRQRTNGQINRLHAAAKGSWKAILSLFAVFNGARAEPAFGTVQRKVTDWQLRRQDHGG